VARYVKAEPVHFAADLFRKAAWLVSGNEMPRNVSVYPFRDRSRVLAPLVWQAGPFAFPFGLVGALAVLGMVLAPRRGSGHAWICAHLLVYAASVVLFFPAARYRLPVIPLCILFAVLGAERLRALFAHRRPGRLAAAILTAACLVAVNWPLAFPTAGVNFEAELHTNVGVGLQVRGRVEEALQAYARALARDPTLAAAHYYRGTALRDRGRTGEAVTAFKDCLVHRPDHEWAMHDLAVVLFERGYVKQSVAILRRVLEINPHYHRAMRNQGIGLLHLGHEEEGQEWLKRSRGPGAEGRD